MRGNSRIYDDPDHARRYPRGRELPPRTLRIWMDQFRRYLADDGDALVLDLGCGVGRFTWPLAEALPRARVLGLDSSAAMLAEALRDHGALPDQRGGRVLLGLADACRLPLADGCVDLVLMSMVLHHIPDKSAAVREVRRVLKGRGRFLLRTSSTDSLDGFLYQRFFPEARAIDQARMWSRQRTIAFMAKHALQLVEHRLVKQLHSSTLEEYVQKIALRSSSDLQAIGDDAFADGMARLRGYAGGQDQSQPVYEQIDLFVFGA